MKVISFDLDGTLISQEFTEMVWRVGIPELVSSHRRISLEEAKSLVFSEYAALGDGSREWYDIGYWFRHFKLPGHWRQLMDRYRDRIRTYPEVMLALDTLKGRYEMVIISNAAGEFIDIEMEEARLEGYFKRIFSATSDFNQVKKTPQFFQMVCGILGIRPVNLIHVGDHKQYDYLVPRSLGIRAFYLDREGKEKGNHVVTDLVEFAERMA